MKPCLLLFAALPWLLVHGQDPAPKPGVEAKAKDKTKAPVYDEKAVGQEQIAAALARAKRENRRVLVAWGANWCTWCRALARLETADKDVAKVLLYEYDVVKIDIGTWEKLKHKDLIQKYGVDLKAGVPYLTVLDAGGNVVVNQPTEPLELADKKKPGHDPAKVIAFLKQHAAPHLEAQAVYDAGLASAKKDGKRVFLHFGAPWCPWCHRLDDWLARPDVAAVLDKDFVDVKIDTDRMAGGAAILARLRNGEDAGIPWFVVLDAEGRPLADSGAGRENIGFPAAPEEIARFRAMLEKVCVKITKDEIDVLAASLVPPEKPGGGPPTGQ